MCQAEQCVRPRPHRPPRTPAGCHDAAHERRRGAALAPARLPLLRHHPLHIRQPHRPRLPGPALLTRLAPHRPPPGPAALSLAPPAALGAAAGHAAGSAAFARPLILSPPRLATPSLIIAHRPAGRGLWGRLLWCRCSVGLARRARQPRQRGKGVGHGRRQVGRGPRALDVLPQRGRPRGLGRAAGATGAAAAAARAGCTAAATAALHGSLGRAAAAIGARAAGTPASPTCRAAPASPTRRPAPGRAPTTAAPLLCVPAAIAAAAAAVATCARLAQLLSQLLQLLGHLQALRTGRRTAAHTCNT